MREHVLFKIILTTERFRTFSTRKGRRFVLNYLLLMLIFMTIITLIILATISQSFTYANSMTLLLVTSQVLLEDERHRAVFTLISSRPLRLDLLSAFLFMRPNVHFLDVLVDKTSRTVGTKEDARLDVKGVLLVVV